MADRKPLPTDRQAIVHKFRVARGSPDEMKCYLTVGLYEDGTPGELFIRIAKKGSTLCGTMDCFAMAISFALQYGVPLEVLVNKFSHVAFEPAGLTGDASIPMVRSVVDYIFRWLSIRFLKKAPE